MLIQFSVTNYKSIKSCQTLSMVAVKGNELADTQPFDMPGETSLQLLPSAAIYGANAAGKTNLLAALRTMRLILADTVPVNYNNTFTELMEG